ncbi:nucleotidyl transferase AbiEii/AbiGii toxin family protein [Flavobacteriaceae bacterium XHP0103]|uniref:nucleotidyl transferase AbiEii/AbiGii toxin family protein n=1 Tax=Marixanthotalea marina TaxID=2844359 RepID=UPI00298A03E7|nr:nucleotidyl transferase AbiEii/AbiGii toxin family protein [Marixanthotalea marina]MBU3821449.1 nucleotidyl transferase AbiEii/AbiGii toxin family protein [Marixanthotalea marina]
MILQREITDKAQEWKVPSDTVDKDYVLGHFLSVFVKYHKDTLIFKGGTCLRKCYIENYRFSEDLDFTAVNKDFVLEQKTLEVVAKEVTKKTGIQFFIEAVRPVLFKDQPKGFQVRIKYWGANHSRNQPPQSHNRWNTKIKLEVSTDELMLLDTEMRNIMHPYSDDLTGEKQCGCYSINEIVSEKLRALVQRSYTAPRDFYDLYHLTQEFTKADWKNIKPIFLKKMEHKNLEYKSPEDLIDDSKLANAERAWKNSVEHQIKKGHQPEADEIIQTVAERIKTYL